MKVFKGWVRRRRHLEGCIAESYVVEEAVEFCAEGLLNDASTAGMPENLKPEVFHASNPLLAHTMISVYGKEMEQAHLCILQNTEDAKSYFSEHMELLKLLHRRGIQVDETGFTLVNLNRKRHLNDPFVLASHVKQIFYIEDPLDPQWSVVVRVPDRDYGGSDSDEEEGIHVEEQAFDFTIPFVETFDDIDGDQDSNYMCPEDETICVES
ncbi:hypothetical protein ACLB2K_026312 [Fragaria x ananassa]